MTETEWIFMMNELYPKGKISKIKEARMKMRQVIDQKKLYRWGIILLIILLPALLMLFGSRIMTTQAGTSATTAICTVPGSYSTIQDAVNDVTCTDIEIDAGMYTEIVYITRNITITGAGPGFTTINGNSQGSVFKCGSALMTDPTMIVRLADMTIEGGVAEYGGGIYNGATCWLTGDNLEVFANGAARGGGIYNLGVITITRSIIAGNNASVHGGGILSEGGVYKNLTMQDSEVSGNYAIGAGGGMYITNRAELKNIDCNSNGTDDFGGCIVAGSPLNVSGIPIMITGSVIQNNSAEGGGTGVAVYCHMTIDATEIISNTGAQTWDSGDKVRGGGITISSDSVLTLTNSTVSNNLLESNVGNVVVGGGIYVYSTNSRLFMENTTVSNNEPDGVVDSEDAALFSSSAVIEIKGSDISNNIGAGIIGKGILTVSNSQIHDNSGAGIVYECFSMCGDNSGVVTLQHSMVTDNGGSGLMGNDVTIKHSYLLNNGGYGVYGDEVYMQFTTISGNTNSDSGGGVTGGALEIRSSTISGNHSDQDGGGIYATDDLILVNSTISNNSSNGNGGGIAAVVASLDSVTVASNTADLDADNAGDGGGIYRDAGAGTFTVHNTILANNSDDSPNVANREHDCMGNFTGSWSLVENLNVARCTGFSSVDNLTGVAPQISALADNGGPTWTHALGAASPAIAHTPGANCLDNDQRGVDRDTAGFCDIGAYELGTCSAPVEPTLTITHEGNNVQLDWNEYSENREVEIWRGTDPFSYGTFSHIWTNLSVNTKYTDYNAIGDLLTNNYYAVRGQNACGDYSTFSNLVGEVDFRLNEEGGLRSFHFAMISIPLEGTSVPTSTDKLADYIDPAGSVRAVARWNPLTHSWRVRRVGSVFGTPEFAISPGDVLFVGLADDSPDSFALIGNVPEAGSMSNILTQSGVNFLLVPLDQSGEFTMTADGLAADIGDISHVGAWSTFQQQWYIRVVGVSGLDFPIRPGYPYGVITGPSTPNIWP
jgi:predicted outer membrane repeat protein